jgi:predicted NACHT family NTPase
MDLNYLYTPTNTIVDPPIDTTIQELPLEQLAWEDFEKLCLAIVQIDYPINDCEKYGTKGQGQEGIDIFARKTNGRYNTYQCKRYQNFKLADLDKAVEYFKKKKFYHQSDSLHLCTSCEWNKTQVQDRFEELKTEFEKEKITLVKWDKIQLSRLLKDKPQIVFDFFGLEWVKKFNGKLALQQISKAKKFDAKQIIEFRTELYGFYSTIFNMQDFAIPIKELNSPYTLQDRFIIPDILSNVKEEGFENDNETSSSIANQDQYYYDDYGYRQVDDEFRRRKFNNQNDVEESSIDIRIKIDDALVSKNKNIIIGDPGAGKSTLLRYIALDILSPKPQLENISQKYGKTLPVWLPFAFITKYLSLNDSLSISEILNLWFNGFGKRHLFEIAKEALDDERLFLVIDGIDEWSSISSAQQAIARIETIRELYDCKILYSSRPYGFRMLKDFFTNLNVLNLAGFSNIQQRNFVEKWYNKWTSLQEDTQDKDFSKTLTDNFMIELEQAGDLKKLAETPLLLSILIIQKMQDSVLPKNKLGALKEITQYLIKKHPVKRITEAGIVQEKLNDIDFKDIFCELAIYIQTESNDGVILKSEAQKIIMKYLVSYAGYEQARAKVRSQELIELGANNYGIIIEKSNDEISFGHKQFQEYLAAQYLYESDEDSVNEFIKQYAANPTSHQVIISLFGLIQLKQVKKFKNHFDALKESVRENYQEDYLKLISYEIAINLDNAPSEIMNNSFETIVNDFEYETDPEYKKALLNRILNALNNVRLKEKAQNFLIQYFPNQNKYRDYRINALKHTNQINKIQLEFLKKAFINGKIDIRRDASYAFKKHIRNEEVYKFIKNILTRCSNPDLLAFAINSITTKDVAEQERDTLINSIVVDLPIVQLYLYKYKVFTKRHTQDDLELVLSIINQLPYQLKQESIELLIDGFNQNSNLKETLIKSVDRKGNYRENKIINDNDIAWKVLFHSFNKHKDVINLVKSEFENEEFPFALAYEHEMLQQLTCYFKDNDELIPSVNKWLDNYLNKHQNMIDSESALASIFIHSEKVKNILLQNLTKTGISHWNVMALLEGWPDDKEIKERLKDYFRTVETTKSSAAAHFVPKVFDGCEKDEAKNILEGILFDEKIKFRERAISALIELDKEYFENNVLKSLIKELESYPKDIFGQYYSALNVIVKNFHSNVKVQSYVLENLESDNSLYSLAAQFFPELVKEEERFLKKSIPLSKDLRSLILEYFTDLSKLPSYIESVLSNFEKEAEEEIQGDMAVCLFNQIKDTKVHKILELSKPLVFAKGFHHEVKRNIAFTGFLISKKLEDYFSIRDDERHKNESIGLRIFEERILRKASSEIMTKSVIENFDYLISYAGKDFKSIVKNLTHVNSVEDIWSFFARYSAKSTPTYSYIMEFISNNTTTIKNRSLINFLDRTAPKSPFLKDILLRCIKNNDRNNNVILAGRLLGTNFKNDTQVHKEVSMVRDVYDVGRIMALCNGWQEEPILKKIYDDIIKHRIPVDNYVGFNLKFLFCDVSNLTKFIKNISTSTGEIKRYHKFFFIPMIERLKRDKDFSIAIKNILLSSDSVNEKISCYNLLSQANMVDEDVTLWKNKITNFKNDFGYDIVTNKVVRLKDVLHDYYY